MEEDTITATPFALHGQERESRSVEGRKMNPEEREQRLSVARRYFGAAWRGEPAQLSVRFPV